MTTVHQASRRHLGGSILPSNNPTILQPVETPQGALQVRALVAKDTHGLFVVADGVLLATHPNGFSCYALATRIAAGRGAAEQADYIVACGGEVTQAGRSFISAAAA